MPAVEEAVTAAGEGAPTAAGGGGYRGGGGGPYGGGERGPYGREEIGPYDGEERASYSGGGGGYRDGGRGYGGGIGDAYSGRARGPYGREERGYYRDGGGLGDAYSGRGRGPYGREEICPYDGGVGGAYSGRGRRYAANHQERGRSVPAGLRGRSGPEGDRHPIGPELKPLSSMRFIVIGIQSSLSQQRIDCERKIISMGGKILSSMEYDLATHIVTLEHVTEGAHTLWEMEGKKVVGSDWVEQHLNPSSADCKTPTNNDDERMVISTSKRKRTCVPRSPSSRRNLFHNEGEKSKIEEYKFHYWLECPFDQSITFTLKQYINDNEDSVVRFLPTPGSEDTHISILTSNPVKMYVRKSYLAMVSMNRDNKTLRGAFGAHNFIVDRSNSVKLGNLNEDALKTITSEEDVKLDREGFVRMIKVEVLLGKSIPDDMFEWLNMLLKGDPDDLLSCHTALLEDHLGGHILMTLYDRLLDLEISDLPSYKAVLLELESYNHWKTSKFLHNAYLKETYEHKDKWGNKTIYRKNVRGLLHLFRNCKNHAAISVEVFGCIVGQHFRKIASDFQRAMYNVKSLQKLNLHYVLS